MSVIIERENIGIFGRMNAGKSSLMNLITQAETSIVDATPGTTTDTKTELFEIHGIGPVRIFDTPGIDEEGNLGAKKKKKALADLTECDLALIIINPEIPDISLELKLIDTAREDKQVLIIYNIFSDKENIAELEKKHPQLKRFKSISLKANDSIERQKLLLFIKDNYDPKNVTIELLPFIKKDEFYVLIIPMDVETPQGRYLRPQNMAEEYITRNWAYPVSYRVDLVKARDKNPAVSSKEKERFNSFLSSLKRKPLAMITDSQAMDIMNLWCPEDIMLTTFSITMINYMSRNKLVKFVNGIHSIDKLNESSTILIVEACNHSRIGEDIGTVQIPNYIKKHYPSVKIEHNFGKEFIENNNLSKYSLIIHCGGCMISGQKFLARLRELDTAGVPYTNYGIFLAYLQGKAALNKVLKPWGLKA